MAARRATTTLLLFPGAAILSLACGHATSAAPAPAAPAPAAPAPSDLAPPAPAPSDAAAEQAVLVRIDVSDDHLGSGTEAAALHSLSTLLEARIREAAVGEFDGNEFGGGECVLYMYGPDADALFGAVEEALRSSPIAQGARVTKRYGPPGAREANLNL